MAQTYEFLKLRGRFVCVNINIFALFWYLVIKNNSLRLSQIKLGRKVSLGVLKAFVKNSLSRDKNANSVFLPVFGHICLYVHRGIKVFDFKSKTVTKLLATKQVRHGCSGK